MACAQEAAKQVLQDDVQTEDPALQKKVAFS